MTLENIIRSLPNWTTKTAAELRFDLLAEVTKTDATLYTGKHVFNILGSVDSYRLVAGTIAAAAAQDPLVRDAQLWLGSTGLDFSSDSTQAMIDQLAVVGSWPAPIMTAIKRIGRPVVTKYADMGGSGEVPSEAVIGLTASKAIKEDAAVDRLQAYREALASWDGNPATEPSL